jgi:hypothetical protein
MKNLQDFKNLVEEEKSDYKQFDMLVRAGLANKAQLARIHRIMDKMTEERPQFNNADREIMRNLFNRMTDLISNNKQIFMRARQAVKEELEEGILDTADIKVSPSGRKVRAHRIKIGDVAYGKDEDIKEDFELVEVTTDIEEDPPFVLMLKRKAIRLYPNKTRVALYYNKQLDKYFTIPYGKGVDSPLQAEETIKEAVDAIGQLQKIKDSHSYGTVNHKDGSASKVDVQTAHAVLMVHKSLNDENKKKFADMVARSAHHMQKATEFSFSKVK